MPWYHGIMITAFFVFLIGACVGSFSSALLHRMRYGGSVLFGRSRCASCRKALGPLDLVPVASWLALRGRCRHCRARFSWQYLALEIGFGSMFLLAFYGSCCYGMSCGGADCLLSAAKAAVFLVFLALVAVYDARHGEIPDAFSLTGTAVALILNAVFNPGAWYWYLAAAAAGAGFFGIQYALGRGKWVGDGDIMMGMMMGAILGWPNVFFGILAAYLMGLFYVIILMLVGRKRLGDTIPLGPFLAAGTAFALLVPGEFIYRFAYAFAF